ncbi:FAD-binding oxidoreductase [Acetobacter sp.]|uniref:FAD-binding oxidoreductase n=1 Tax=Acetobacter sp. TaxID=440 RepID=UPI0039E83BFE
MKDAKTKTGPETRLPTLYVAIGRQRVGKTTLLKLIDEVTKHQGGDIEVWNADTLNRSNSVATIGREVIQAPGQSVPEQTDWLLEKLDGMKARGKDVLLDVGGGWTAFHQVVKETGLLEGLPDMGISLVSYFVIGNENGDLDYLDNLQQQKFFPPRCAIVINGHLLPQGTNTPQAMADILSHPVVTRAIQHGETQVSIFPVLNGIKKLNDRNQGFLDYANNVPVNGFPPSGVLDRLRVKKWLQEAVPKFFDDMGPELLPRMPDGLPSVTWNIG